MDLIFVWLWGHDILLILSLVIAYAFLLVVLRLATNLLR